MFINSWPSRAVLMIALQHAAWRRIKDSPLEQSEAELLAATDRQAALLTRESRRQLRQEKAEIRHHFDESLKFTKRDYRWGSCAFLMDTSTCVYVTFKETASKY